MVGSAVIRGTVFFVLVDIVAKIFPHRSALVSQGSQVRLTTVEHMGHTLHRVILDSQRVVQIHLIEVPFVLEPGLGMTHVHTVVITETVPFMNRLIGVIHIVLNHLRDLFLRKTGIGCQLLDIAIGKTVDIDPLFCTQQVIDRLIVDTLRILHLCTQGHLQMLVLGVDVVERSTGFLQVVMTAL